ncbi:hypothetical protein HELRODRAFT_81264, partial [Helobdella robusta]|uniref:PDZ domain-containing protein n=1 Tax=Helobdella robusta TaxID=6412 RepID=T1G4C2_HELRO
MAVINMDACKSLGISVVGHSNGHQGDCGIFVGAVRKGGGADISKKIEPGDLLLEVNGIDLEKMSNDDALSVLRSELSKGGIAKILVAKYWD